MFMRKPPTKKSANFKCKTVISSIFFRKWKLLYNSILDNAVTFSDSCKIVELAPFL